MAVKMSENKSVPFDGMVVSVMMKGIVYLLGAGASSEVLPLAGDFGERLDQFAARLRGTGPKSSRPGGFDPVVWGGGREAFLRAIDWLESEVSRHLSVDTFAKKLYFLNDSDNLKKLKAVVSAFMITEQANTNVDKRYDAFLATVLQYNEYQKYPKLPKGLHILTWNYDTQLEKAFFGFCQDNSWVLQELINNENVRRINGSCAPEPYAGPRATIPWNVAADDSWEEGIKIFQEYMSSTGTISPGIQFAWERPTAERLTRDPLLNTHQSETAVVIGYSFPYFNREVDQLIFNQFPNLRRIYLQYPDDFQPTAVERVRSLFPEGAVMMVAPVPAKEQFYIPKEFWTMR